MGRLSIFRVNRSSRAAVAMAMNDNRLRLWSNARPFQGVICFGVSFFTSFALCCAFARPMYADSISGQASVIAGVFIEIKGERVKLGSVDAPEPLHTCIHAKTAPGAAVSRRH
ncbi:hypothetical protein [Paracoccus sp. PAMC 22219]|uniref:hypothetical protein n=1 Tax=Paracoccus sp. PAMC 22219 TaxID=1569209 RepID=UPI0018CDCB34|nr:hypothetical protein [Paracoccus sp. PAMC 22219]